MLCRRKQKSNKVQRGGNGGSQNRENQSSTAVTHNRKQKHTTIAGIGLARQLGIGLQRNKPTNIIRNINTDGKSGTNRNKFEDLFKNNHTLESLTIDIPLKKDSKPVQQKETLVPIHFQNSVRREVEKLIEKGQLEKTD